VEGASTGKKGDETDHRQAAVRQMESLSGLDQRKKIQFRWAFLHFRAEYLNTLIRERR